ncbi:YihY/virulence factor BrkB family protein [Actinomadura scrupuli]|uniref:YihY/virulence factor BrkB family protein n=1 Tax=Actinomadura scrupuli TaxID=559629 RepID=UPI003D95E637
MSDDGDRRESMEERAEREPDSPTDLPAVSWWGAAKRVLSEFKDDDLTDRAAALTYYSVLSIFPALLVVVSLVGLAGRSVSQSLITNVGDLAPGSVKQVITNAITELQRGQGGAGLVALISLAAGVWSASKYVAAFMRASNAVYDVAEGRPIWKTLPIRIAVTLVTLTLLSASAIAVVISGALADRTGRLLGIGTAAVTTWNIAKWPILLVIVSFLFALLYWASPNAKQGFRWVTPGGVMALVIWLVASAGFAVFVAEFGSYNKTYGSLAGVVVFLVWLWISNLALLLGAELNAELERGRAIAAGLPPDQEPYVRMRDTRALPDD